LGAISGTHGIRGLLRFHPLNEASAASAVAAAGHTVFLRATADSAAQPGDPFAVTLLSARPHSRVVLLEIEGIHGPEQAAALARHELSVPEATLPPPAPGEYYAYQLEGLEVVTVGGESLGTVASVIPTGSNDVLVVRTQAREHLIPVIEDVIRAVDLKHRRVTIEPIEGLLEDR
jgi:16S rRNA processing protein RimM